MSGLPVHNRPAGGLLAAATWIVLICHLQLRSTLHALRTSTALTQQNHHPYHTILHNAMPVKSLYMWHQHFNKILTDSKFSHKTIWTEKKHSNLDALLRKNGTNCQAFFPATHCHRTDVQVLCKPTKQRVKLHESTPADYHASSHPRTTR